MTDRRRQTSDDRHWDLIEETGLMVIELRGDVIDAVDQRFQEETLHRISAYTGTTLLVDFAACSNMASSALGFLVQIQRHASDLGREVCWTGARGQVANLVKVLGIHRLMREVPSRTSL